MVTTPAPQAAIGILAWNEEHNLRAMLASLFQQSLFQKLGESGRTCEIICVANACTDATAAVAEEVFREQAATHSFSGAFTWRVVEIAERGKANAWNVFVHELADARTSVFFLADADIVLLQPDTLWNMCSALDENPAAMVAVDRPVKDLAFKAEKSLSDRISLATSEMTQAEELQLTGQLYCIRAEVARNLYLPRDVVVEDGFIKSVVCTDFLTAPLNPARIVRARGASHSFEAYVSPAAIFRNQKRQMIGQAAVHVLVDHELRQGAHETRWNFGRRLNQRETEDPQWLMRLMAEHTKRTRFFWRLFPGAMTFRFRRLARIKGARRLSDLLAAGIGFAVTLLACWSAHRYWKGGSRGGYWPRAEGVNGAGPAVKPRAVAGAALQS